jgi:hypothetical protein
MPETVQLLLFPETKPVKLPASYVNPDVRADRSNTYEPGHPWYYILGGSPEPASRIPPREFYIYSVYTGEMRQREITSTLQELRQDAREYNALAKAGPEYYAGKKIQNEDYYDYKDNPVYSGEFMEWAENLSLMHNHISYNKAILLNKQILCPQCGKPLLCTSNFVEFPSQFFCEKCGGEYEATGADTLTVKPPKVRKKSGK